MKRIDLGDQFLSNQSNQQTIDNIVKLRNSVEEKRKLLDKIYLEAAGEDENSEIKTKNFGATMLKKVNFEPIDPAEEPNVEKLFNNTFTITKIRQHDANNTFKPKNYETIKKKSFPSDNEKKNVPGTKKIQNTLTKPVGRQVLTFHQKKIIEKEKKQKLEANLKEIRNKILARKFAYIWLRKHLNKNNFLSQKNSILPSEAQKYYKNKILKKIIQKWQNEIKFERNEWRLNVKAECHHNYVLYNKVWNRWTEFKIESIHEKQIINKADTHYFQILKKKIFFSWTKFHKRSLKEKLNLDLVREKRNTEIQREIFEIWHTRLLNKIRNNDYTEIAQRHHQFFILSNCYSIWYFKLVNEKDDRRKNRKADNFYKENLLRKHFASIKMYTMYRRKKKIQKQKLDDYAESQLVYRIFQTWQQKYQFRMRVYFLEEEITCFTQTYLKYRVLKYMQQEYNSRILLKIKETKAIKFFNRKIKLKVFNGIKQNLIEVKDEIGRVKEAEKFDYFWCKKIVFYKWLDRLDDRNEIKSMHLLFKAKKHYESYLFRTGFSTWKYFVKQKKKQDAKEKIAITFQNLKLVRKFFEQLRIYVEITQKKRENHRLAEEFYKTNTYGKYFEKWYNKYEQTIEYQMNLRIAILHHESSLHSKIFTIWSQKYNSMLRDELNENRAQFWNRKYLLKNYLNFWIQSYRETKKEFIDEEKALIYDFKRTCTPVFDSWKKFIEHKRFFIYKCNLADDFYKKKLEKKALAVWKFQAINFKKINQIVADKFTQKQKEKCQRFFLLWINDVKEKKVEKRNEEIAITFYLKHLMIKIIYEWRGYCVNKALKRYNDQNTINKFEIIRSKLIKSHLFTFWQKKCCQVISEENKEKIAVNFNNNKLKGKYFTAFKVYFKFSIRKKLLDKQARWFLEMRLKSDIFYKWTAKYDHECSIRDKNEKALLLWSINIQKNCFIAWQNWIQTRKQKKERYKQALEMRQFDIIKECSRKFLKFSMDSKTRRIQTNRILKEKFLLNSVELEAKYFNIWLNKCKFKSVHKIQDRKIAKIKNVLLDVKSKKSAILEDVSLDKKENMSGPTTLFKNLDSKTKIRPAPRKPAFIESIDYSKGNLEAEKIVETVEINNELIEENLNVPNEVVVNQVLLPPSAFLNPKLNSPNESAFSENQLNNDLKNDLKSSSMSTICNTEVFKEINFGKSITNLNITNSSSTNSLNNEIKIKKSSNKDNELVNLKKRLETLAIKSDKLKRLKEQEKLLLNCIKSNEINQTSMCETIYQEKDQVQSEIRELYKFIKIEKPIVHELLIKHKLA